MSDPLFRPLWRGRTNVDALTIAALEYAESLRPGKAPFVVTQGSYQGGGGEVLSAGTHDLGGALDLRWTGDYADVLALRKAGFAAWLRTPAQGPWPYHIHAILVDHPRLSAGAAKQVVSYRAGRNGLANNGPDDGPRLNPIPVFDFQEGNIMADQADRIIEAVNASTARVIERIGGAEKRTRLRDIPQYRDLRNRLQVIEEEVAVEDQSDTVEKLRARLRRARGELKDAVAALDSADEEV